MFPYEMQELKIPIHVLLKTIFDNFIMDNLNQQINQQLLILHGRFFPP